MLDKTSQIKFNDLDIEACFKSHYIVPDYQREYIWKTTQVTQLLQDIYDEYSGNSAKEYFIGSTVVYRNSDGVFELIDGQQRTTTLYLILAAFRSIYDERGIATGTIDRMLKDESVNSSGDAVDQFKLMLQYKDSSDILEQIISNIDRPDDLKGSSGRLFDAYEDSLLFLKQNFPDDEQAEMKKFFVYFYRNVRFIQIITPEISDALKIFETINERGIGLNPMDLLKNLLFRQIDKKDFTKLKIEWEKLIKTLEKNGEKPLRFLRYFLMANYQIKNDKGDEIIREDDIYKWITKNEDQLKYNRKPFQFVELLTENVQQYTQFLNGQDAWGQNVYLNNIKKLSGGAFRQHLILLLSSRHFKKEMFRHFSKQIESLMFWYFLNNEQAKVFEKNFSSWAKLLLKIRNKDALNEFLNKHIKPEMEKRKPAVRSRFLMLTQNDLQRYRLVYLLAKLTQYVDQERLGSYNDQSLDTYVTKGVEIEHILPERPDAALRSEFANYDELKGKLGNLTLLEKSINCAIGNADFYSTKAPAYAKSQFYLTKSIAKLENIGGNTSVNRINKRLKSFKSWDESSIVERQKVMLNLMGDIWDIKQLE